jgi:glycosyltransferase involved in cell wall biosynthesis
MPPDRTTLLQRAIDHQRAGEGGAAAALLAEVLRRFPEDPDALQLLGVLRAQEGDLPEAFDLCRRAGEATAWTNDIINRNYAYVARQALANADSGLLGVQRRRREAWLARTADRRLTGAAVSVLLYPVAGPGDLPAVLERLARGSLRIAEVLAPQGWPAAENLLAGPWTVRRVATGGAADPFECINRLAAAASGDYLWAVGGDTFAGPGAADALVAVAGHWTLAVADGPGARGVSRLLAECPTAGMSLVSREIVVATPDAILVPRVLHERVGGYRPQSASPLLDYCLRLLGLAEPWLVRFQAAARMSTAEAEVGRLCVLADYLGEAITAGPVPNPFAPVMGNWGLQLLNHVIGQGLFLSQGVMAGLNDAISDHLRRNAARPVVVTPGLNLVGPVHGEFGLAENMRALARACLAGNIPCAIRDLNLALGARRGDHSLSGHLAEEARHDCSVYFVNPDARELYRQSLDALTFQRPVLDFRHRKIGYWFWELDKIPQSWWEALNKVDEVWVASDFVAAALRRATDKPVVKIPPPIDCVAKGQYRRQDFDLPENVFLFLFSFDYGSFVKRKNPQGLIRAFRRAFPEGRRDVGLVIKSINGPIRPAAAEAVLGLTGGDPRIFIRDGFLSRDQVLGLQGLADAYASLHRSEGFGLGLAESMFQGKPVLATGYSGNLEFMNEANSALVRYSLIRVEPGDYLYDDPEFIWAEPDEEHAAWLMRRMVDEAGYRQGLAVAGQQFIHRQFSLEAAAARIRQRLDSLARR